MQNKFVDWRNPTAVENKLIEEGDMKMKFSCQITFGIPWMSRWYLGRRQKFANGQTVDSNALIWESATFPTVPFLVNNRGRINSALISLLIRRQVAAVSFGFETPIGPRSTSPDATDQLQDPVNAPPIFRLLNLYNKPPKSLSKCLMIPLFPSLINY